MISSFDKTIIKLSWFRSLECISSRNIKTSICFCMHAHIHEKYKHIYSPGQYTHFSSSIISSLSLNKNDKANPVLYMYILFSKKSGKRPWKAIFVYITKFHAYLDFICRCHTKIVNPKLFISNCLLHQLYAVHSENPILC